MRWTKLIKEMPVQVESEDSKIHQCISIGCKKKTVSVFYCEEHSEKVIEFSIGKRSKVVVDSMLRRLKRRKPCWMILDGTRMYVNRFGWVKTGELSETRHVKNLLYEMGYKHVKYKDF